MNQKKRIEAEALNQETQQKRERRQTLTHQNIRIRGFDYTLMRLIAAYTDRQLQEVVTELTDLMAAKYPFLAKVADRAIAEMLAGGDVTDKAIEELLAENSEDPPPGLRNSIEPKQQRLTAVA